jgi:hypothetical protein
VAIISTERNRVYAYQRTPEDVLVAVSWLAPIGDGQHLRTISLPCQPISEYDAMVEWAVSIADEMAHPIHVLPLNHADIFKTGRWEPYRKFLSDLNDQDRAQVQRIMIDAAIALTLDSNVRSVRAEGLRQLIALGVLRP